jgi:hypothetical protein
MAEHSPLFVGEKQKLRFSGAAGSFNDKGGVHED